MNTKQHFYRKNFVAYLRQKKGVILILLLFFMIYAGIFYLYHISTDCLLFAGSICLIIGSIAKKLSLKMDPMTATVLTDEKWAQFMIEQILSNSLKYTRTGSIHIYQEGQGSLVVEDTGIGIDPADIPRLGERGFTGYNGRIDKKM